MSDQRFIELVKAPRDRRWLSLALQYAVMLEFATIPPYLTAYWSIKDETDPVAVAIREIIYEEMLHMALACNMLSAIGGTPQINHPDSVPKYPGPLPGGVKPDLRVALEGLSHHSIRTFMKIEEPEEDIAQVDGLEEKEEFARIGEFYDAIAETFKKVNPIMNNDRQISGYLSPMVIETLGDVKDAIELIKEQGEGSKTTPNADGDGTLAHYYRFKELDVGYALKYDVVSKAWLHNGPQVNLPDTWPVAQVPQGGYAEEEVSPEVWKLLTKFDVSYTKLLGYLQEAWEMGDQGAFHKAMGAMFELRGPARALMSTQIPNQRQSYAPCFRLVQKPIEV